MTPTLATSEAQALLSRLRALRGALRRSKRPEDRDLLVQWTRDAASKLERLRAVATEEGA